MHKFTLFTFQLIKIGGLTVLLVLMSFQLLAQERTVKGTVTTSDTKETLPGASIAIKGTTTGTIKIGRASCRERVCHRV